MITDKEKFEVETKKVDAFRRKNNSLKNHNVNNFNYRPMKKLDRNENKSSTAILKPNDEPLKRCESENFVLLPAGQMVIMPPSKTDYGGGRWSTTISTGRICQSLVISFLPRFV